jgi:hypothetical protein
MREYAVMRFAGWLREEIDCIHGVVHVCELILEIYPAHVMASVRMHAQLLGFDDHFLPSELTDQYKPLDCSGFRAIKSRGRAEY